MDIAIHMLCFLVLFFFFKGLFIGFFPLLFFNHKENSLEGWDGWDGGSGRKGHVTPVADSC